MAIYTITGLKQKISEVLASNNSGQITAEKLADLMYDLVDTSLSSGSLAWPWIGEAQLTGSLKITGDAVINGIPVATETYVDTAIIALSSSIPPGFPYTGNAQITGTLNISGNGYIDGQVIATNDFVVSNISSSENSLLNAISASESAALTAIYNLSSSLLPPFPYVGNAQITGTLNVTNPVYVNSIPLASEVYVSNAISSLSASIAFNTASFIPLLQNGITVQLGTGVTFGGVSTGTTFNSGSTIEQVLRTLLIKEIPPTYTQPVSSISSNVSFASREVGEIISPTFTLAYTQNDAGTSTHYILRKNGATLSSVTASASPQYLSDLSVQVTNSSTTYVHRVNYNTGPIKNTNLGNPYPTGQILSGFKDSSALTLLGYRKGFYGVSSTPSPTAPNASAAIRSLSNSILNPNNLSTFTISIPAGTTMVVFAYPNTLTTPNSVLYVEGGNVDVKGVFTEISVTVEGANGYVPIPYRVYYYIPVLPFASSATYNVTI